MKPIDQIFDRVPPQSLESESAVLGALMIDPRLIGTVSGLCPELFYKGQHREIYLGMADAYVDKGTCDLVILSEELKKRKTLEQVGGTFALCELEESVPTSANIEHHVKILTESMERRKIIAKSEKVTIKAFDETATLEEIQQDIMNMMQSGNENRKDCMLSDATNKMIEKIDGIGKGTIKALTTGIPSVDFKIGGFHPGKLITIARITSHGKTSLAVQIVVNECLKNRKPMAYISMEMPIGEMAERFYAQAGKINLWNLSNGMMTETEQRKFSAIIGECSSAPLIIDDQSNQGIGDIFPKLRRWKIKYNLQGVVIDYLGLMKKPEADRHDLSLGLITAGLKGLTKELEIPIFLLAQFSKEVGKQNREPILADLKDAVAVEQDSDIVVFVYNPHLNDSQFETSLDIESKIIVAKFRGGPLSKTDVHFVKRFSMFKEINSVD